jgi:hypothetical protein
MLRHVHVKVWAADESHRSFFFVSPQPARDKTYLMKAAAGGKGSVEQARQILGVDGPLPSRFSLVETPIYWDDQVAVVLQKVRAVVGGGEAMYAWYRRKVANRVAFCSELASALLLGRTSVRAEEVNQRLGRLLGGEWSGTGLPGRADAAELHEALMHAFPETVETPLAFRVKSRDLDVLIPADPFRASIDDVSGEQLTFEYMMGKLLYDLDRADDVINVLVDGMRNPAVQQLYFPQSPPRPVTISQEDEGFLHKLGGVVSQERRGEPGNVKFMLISVRAVGSPIDIKLRGVFDNMTLDTVCPLIKLRNSENVLYRVNTAALRTIPVRIVRMWTNDVTKRRESVILKLNYGEFFVTLLVFGNMTYHVKATTQTTQTVDISYIGKHIAPFVNGALARLNELLSVTGVVLPMLTVDMLHRDATLEMKWSKELAFGRTMPQPAKIKARLLGLPVLFHEVFSAKGEKPRSVTLRYKRCSDYSPEFDVSAFVLSNMAVMSQQELVRAIMRVFQLSREDAEGIYSGMQDKAIAIAGFQQKHGVTVALTRVGDTRILLEVRGAKVDEGFCERVALVVRAVLDNGDLTSHARAGAGHIDVARLFEDVGDDFMGSAAPDDDEPEQHHDEIETKTKTAASVPPPLGNANDRYVLRRLQHADPKLFSYDVSGRGYKSYPALCAANAMRQPIAVSTEELHKLPKGGFENAVHTGSNPEAAAKNAYICPDVWCSGSDVPMTREDFEKSGCPLESDTPIVMYKPSDPRKRFAGFLDKSKHPKELCMPCCFNIDHNAKHIGAMQRRARTCGILEDDGDDDATYVKGNTVFPLQPDRLGRLPNRLAALLNGDGECDPQKAPCMLRKGVKHNSQYMLSCLAMVLGVAGGWEELVELVSRKMSPHEYVVLNGGHMMRAFSDETARIRQDNNYESFRGWFLSQKEYIALFGLEYLEDVVRKVADVGALQPPMLWEVEREFSVFVSQHNFISFLASSALKDHRHVLELVLACPEWLNPAKIKPIIVEDDGDVYVTCTRHVPAMEFYGTPEERFAVIVKHKDFYEPVVIADSKNPPVYSMARGDSGGVDQLARFAMSNCKGIVGDPFQTAKATVTERIVSAGFVVSHQVLDATLQVVGLMASGKLYVPLPVGGPIQRGLSCMHLTRVRRASFSGMAPAMRLFDSLALAVDAEFYSAKPHPNKMAVVLGARAYVPVAPGRHDEMAEDVDVQIFAGVMMPNEAFSISERWGMQQAALQGYTKAVYSRIHASQEGRLEFEFLRHPSNTLGRGFRLQKMKELVMRTGVNVRNEFDIDRLSDMFLTRDTSALIGAWEGVGSATSILLTQADVDKGMLVALVMSRDHFSVTDAVKDVSIEATDPLGLR